MKIYYFDAQCSHDGDVQREIGDITRGDAAEIVNVEIPNHGDHDYFVTISFKILDERKFEEATGYSPSDFSSYEK